MTETCETDSETEAHPQAPLAPHPTLEKYYAGPEHKRSFVRRIFDESAGEYDRVERMMALGTGLVAREAVRLVGDPGAVIGLDPSPGMLAQAAQSLPVRLIVGRAERLPFADRSFDFLSMGYALRHVSDVSVTMGEFFRVLRPGGRLCLLEITRPRGRIPLALVRFYMKAVVPSLSRFTAGPQRQRLLWEYYWDTINACVPPAALREAMEAAGFADVKRHAELGIFSEYTGRKP